MSEHLMKIVPADTALTATAPQPSRSASPPIGAPAVPTTPTSPASMSESVPTIPSSPQMSLPFADSSTPVSVSVPPESAAPSPTSVSVPQATPVSVVKTASVTASVPPPSPTSPASVIASLRNVALEEVEASLVATREAYKRGEVDAIQAALIDQFAMLTTLGIKLLRIAGDDASLSRIQTFGNLGLRAIELSRKSLEALRRLIPPPGRPADDTQSS